MSALATIAIATAAIAGGEIIAAAGGGGSSTPLIGDSCAFGINGVATFAFAAAVESADAEVAVFTTDSRRRVGGRKLRAAVARVGGSRI